VIPTALVIYLLPYCIISNRPKYSFSNCGHVRVTVFTERRFRNYVIRMCYEGLLIVMEKSGENVKKEVSWLFNVLFWHFLAGRG
jgi:hypothetical protein